LSSQNYYVSIYFNKTEGLDIFALRYKFINIIIDIDLYFYWYVKCLNVW